MFRGGFSAILAVSKKDATAAATATMRQLPQMFGREGLI